MTSRTRLSTFFLSSFHAPFATANDTTTTTTTETMIADGYSGYSPGAQKTWNKRRAVMRQ